MSTHPKQRNASKIQAHRVATWSAEPLPFGTFEPAKSKGGWVGQEAFADSRDWLGGRNGPGQHRAKAAIPKARQPPIRNRKTPAIDSNPTDCSRLAEPLLFSTFKSKGGRVKHEALASSRHWLGGRNGPEQNRAASAIPKARHSPQHHR